MLKSNNIYIFTLNSNIVTEKFGANSIPSQLMQAEIRILDPKICLARGSYESYNFNKDTMICAGFIRGGVDACQV